MPTDVRKGPKRDAPPGGAGWISDRSSEDDVAAVAKFVQKGRVREIVRTLSLLVGLYVLQIPLYLTATGRLASAASENKHLVPARLLLAVDLACIFAQMVLALRAWGLVRSRRAKLRVLWWARISLGVVFVCAAAKFAGNVAIWILVARSPDNVADRFVALFGYRQGELIRAPYSLAFLVISLVALVSLLVAASMRGITHRLYAQEADKVKQALRSDQTKVAKPASRTIADSERSSAANQAKAESRDTIICCSGGGIRAAAFSLGGLQVLQTAGIYDKASAVVGVSGGGYTAAAHHVVRWNVRRRAFTAEEEAETPLPWRRRIPLIPSGFRIRYKVDGDWELKKSSEVPAFAPTSPELHWLRRHTRYILDSVGTFVQAVLSLTWGIAVNILLITVAIGAAGWLLGWLFLASGRLTDGSATGTPVIVEFGDEWGANWCWIPWLCYGLLIAGGVAFAFEKFIDRFVTVSVKLSVVLRFFTRTTLFGGAATSALLLGLPWVVETVAEWAATSDSIWAAIAHQVGMVPSDICEEVLRTQSACGVKIERPEALTSPSSQLVVNSVSIATVVSAVLAVIATLSGEQPSKDDEGKAFSRFLGRLWTKFKNPFVPYLAVTVIAAVAATALIRTVSVVVMDKLTIVDWCLGLSLTAALVVVRVFTEPNRTSMHQFFRERISKAFFVHRSSDTKVGPIDYRQPLRFSQSAPRDGKSDGPRLVSCAVANVIDSDLIPSKRGCTPFVFDDQRMGLTDRMLPNEYARRPSAAYEFLADPGYRDATIPAAVAMSAAAFSPLAGRENARIAPYRVVLALANARLGVWLPNPMWMDHVTLLPRLLALRRFEEAERLWQMMSTDDRLYLGEISPRVGVISDKGRAETLTTAGYKRGFWGWVRATLEFFHGVFKKPGIFNLLREAFGSASVYDRFLYVTDGGHYDNLGLVEALRRRPDHIYVLDASNDHEDTFVAIGQAMATAQMDLGCVVEMDPRGMARMKETRSGAAWCTGTFRYADGDGGTIHLAKAVLTTKAPWDIEAYASAHPDFPRTSTGQQLYSEFDFEAYRALGHFALTCLLDEPERARLPNMQSGQSQPDEPSRFGIARFVKWWTT